MPKTACWVYQDRFSNDLVLVRKPHRRTIERKYYVVAPVFKRAGFRPDVFICASARNYGAVEFRRRYQYVGGLNTSNNNCKKIHIVEVGEYFTFTWKGDPYTEPEWYYTSKKDLLKVVNTLKPGRYPLAGVYK